uniref:Rhomboid domain-containing protein n=1 Tax=Angiostrongylus cantonensis TaxID=6313 RepID=A0A0K0DKK1_ANGCA
MRQPYGLSTIVCILGIAVGILLLLQPSWHEFLILYRQLLAYLRRSDPATYWTCYRVFLSCWIGIHFAHLLTVLGTILGVQMTKSRLVVPQIVILVCEIGIYIIGTFILIVISVTGSKVTWIALTGVLFFGFFARYASHFHFILNVVESWPSNSPCSPEIAGLERSHLECRVIFS